MLCLLYHLSRVVRKRAFCICENKDADQLCGDREADQRLCFRYTDSTIPLLPKSEISSLQSSVAVQPGLCQTRSETPITGFLTRLILVVFLHVVVFFVYHDFPKFCTEKPGQTVQIQNRLHRISSSYQDRHCL